MECPKCHEKLEPLSFIPTEQQFVVELKYEGDYLCAATLGGTITNMERLLVAVAKDAGGNVSVYIKDISYGDHTARIAFMIIIAQSSALPATSDT